MVLTLLNWLGLRAGSRAQELTSLVKALALVGFVVACFVVSPKTQAPMAASIPAAPGSVVLAMVIAMQAVVVTYDGWYSAIYFMEEDKDPANNLPRSAIGGVLASIAIFLLVNAALLHVLPMAQLAASQVPAADAAMMVFGSHGKQIILVIGLIAVMSTINAMLMITPRILFAMGRDGLLPRGLSSVNSGGTPAPALFACAGVVIALVSSGSFESLIAIASFLFVVLYLSGFVSLIRLRVRQPELARPFQMWGYPWSLAAILLASVGFLIAFVLSDIKHSLFGLIVMGATYPIYVLGVKNRAKATIVTDVPALAEAEATPEP